MSLSFVSKSCHVFNTAKFSTIEWNKRGKVIYKIETNLVFID